MKTHYNLPFAATLLTGAIALTLGLFIAQPVEAGEPGLGFWMKDQGPSPVSSEGSPAGTGGGLAVGDVDGDGTDETVIGADLRSEPLVRVLGADNKLKRSFLAYAKSFKGGVRVAVGDVDGDGIAEIVTAPGPGLEPRLYAYDGNGQRKIVKEGVMVYNKAFLGGVHVALGDVDGDGKNEVVTSPGPGGGPHIVVLNGALQNAGRDFFAFEEGMRDGVSVAVAKTKRGGRVVVAAESWSQPVVREFSFFEQPFLVKEFWGAEPGDRHGLSIAAIDWDGDGSDEVATSPNGGVTTTVNIFDIYGSRWKTVVPYGASYTGAVSVTRAARGLGGFLAVPTAALVVGPILNEKYIDVNLKQQRLYAYEHGRLARTFLVSTGVRKHPTPVMQTSVQRKIFMMDYRWDYGPDNPDNYYLPRVKYNLNIRGPYYIHYAYWHNNFGHPMSHGCVNTGLKDAQWIYTWADVGTPVATHY